MNTMCDNSNKVPMVITVDGLMTILHIGRNTAYDLVRAGKIRSVRVGKQIRIPREAVIQFLAGSEA